MFQEIKPPSLKNYRLSINREFSTNSGGELSGTIEYQHDADALLALTAAERKIIDKVGELQGSLDSARWRVYGGVTDGKMWAHLSQELYRKEDDHDFWSKVVEKTKATEGYLQTMDHDEGNLHVDMFWPVATVTVEQLHTLIARLAQETEELWTLAGFAVL